MTHTEALRHLQQGPLAPLYFVTGAEPYFIRQVVEGFRQIIPPGARDMNADLFFGAEVRPADLVSLAETLPIGSPNRLILIRDADQLKTAQALDAYLARPNPTTILVFVAAKPDLRKRFFATLKTVAIPIVCAPLRDGEVEGWIAQEGERRGLRPSREAAWLLKERHGNDLSAIAQGIEMLALLSPETGETLAEVAKRVISGGRSRTVFEWIDQVMEKDLRGALRSLYGLMEDGEAPLGLLALLARQIRMMTVAHQKLAAGAPEVEAGKSAGLPPFLTTAFFRRLARWRAGEIRRAFDLLREADSELKGSGMSPFVLERIVLEMCATHFRGNHSPSHFGVPSGCR